MVKVTVTGALVILTNTPPISPVPLAGIPVTVPVLFLVQLKTVLATLPVRAMTVIPEPEQIVCAAGVATAFGTGFTTTVAVMGAPMQVTPALV